MSVHCELSQLAQVKKPFTGNFGQKPDDVAHAMLDGIDSFARQNPNSCVKRIRVVIFQQSMLRDFRKCALKKAGGKKGFLSAVSSAISRAKGQSLGSRCHMQMPASRARSSPSRSSPLLSSKR